MKERVNKPGNVHFPKYPEAEGDTRLFPDEYTTDAASATECTGLIQVAPAEESVQEAYDDVYSFRTKPESSRKQTE